MESPKRQKRVWTAEQKFNMLQLIEADVKSGLTQTQAIEKQGISYSNSENFRKDVA